MIPRNIMIGYIYKLVKECDDDKMIYIGSTNLTLRKRLTVHKKKAVDFPNRKVYKYIAENGGWNKFEIKLIEKIEYENDTELKIKEEHYRANQVQNLLLNSQKSYVGLELKEYSKQYYKENINKRKEYIEKNKDRIKEHKKEYDKQYREKNIERISEYKKEWKKSNKERISQYKKEWKKANKERISQYKKEWKKANKERISEYKKEHNKEYREKNKEQILKTQKEYRKKNKEQINEKAKKMVQCEICGTTIRKSSLHLHKKSHKCIQYKEIYDFINY